MAERDQPKEPLDSQIQALFADPEFASLLRRPSPPAKEPSKQEPGADPVLSLLDDPDLGPLLKKPGPLQPPTPPSSTPELGKGLDLPLPAEPGRAVAARKAYEKEVTAQLAAQAAQPKTQDTDDDEFVELTEVVPAAAATERPLPRPSPDRLSPAEPAPLPKEDYLQMIKEAEKIFAGRPLDHWKTDEQLRLKSTYERGIVGGKDAISLRNMHLFKVWATLRHLPDERPEILKTWDADEQGLRQAIIKAQELFGDWDTTLPRRTLEEPVTPTLDLAKLTPGATFYTVYGETCTFKGYDEYGSLLASSGGKLPWYSRGDVTTKPPSEWALQGNSRMKPGDVVYVEGERKIVLSPSGTYWLYVGNDRDGSVEWLSYLGVGRVVPKEPPPTQ